jgi:hypothetical protein
MICATLTFLKGFTLASISNLYWHNSHFLISELLIHFCRQLWWTNINVPEHKHGLINVWSLLSVRSQWQILQNSPIEDTVDIQDTLRLMSVRPVSEPWKFITCILSLSLASSPESDDLGGSSAGTLSWVHCGRNSCSSLAYNNKVVNMQYIQMYLTLFSLCLTSRVWLFL